MAMMDCPECGKGVSDAAASCPGCGHPIGNATDAVRSERTLTTQETGKDAKVHKGVGCLTMIAGFIAAGSGSDIGGFVFLVGVFWYAVAMIYGWWHYS